MSSVNANPSKLGAIWDDLKTYRNAYILTIITAFGGMLFGWDTGLVGGILEMEPFQTSFDMKNTTAAEKKAFSNLSGNIVSVLQAGCFFGAMSSFYVSDQFGRRSALIVGDVIFLLGSVLQTCSGLHTTSLALLYVGRVVGGFGVGLISAVVPSYIGENVNKEIRGRCIGAMQLFNVTGIMLSFFINYGIINSSVAGTALQWRIPFALQMIPGVFLLVGLATQNESPRWLVEKGRLDAAHAALTRVRAKPANDPGVSQELQEIITDFEGQENLSLLQQLRASCANKQIFYQVSMGVVLMFWQQWTGTNSINYYAPQIFKSIGIEGQQSGLFATGIYGVVKVVVTALALMLITEQMGRKYSLLISSAGQAFAMFYIGIQGAVSPVIEGEGLTGSGTFAIVCIYLFVVFYSFGWGPIPFVLAAECSPNHVRSLTMALSLMTQWLFNFVIARAVPVMLTSITYGTYLLFGCCSICCFVYTLFCVPETAKVPLESIPKLFEGNIMKGAFMDTFPKRQRAKLLQLDDSADASNAKLDGVEATHVERSS